MILRWCFMIPTLLLFSLCCGGGGGGGSSLAGGDGISGTGDFALSKMELASDSYGSGNTNDFTLNTLAPIIRLQFDTPLPDHPENYFKVTLLDLNLQQSLEAEAGSLAFQTLKVAKGSSGKDLYLHVPKSSALNSSGYELRPGHHYRYTITPVNKKLFLNGVETAQLEGYLRVKNITLTYLGDFEKRDSLVNDRDYLLGMGTLQPEFIIHSRFPLSGDNIENGPLSGLSVSFAGLQLLKNNNSFSYIEVLNHSSTSTHIKIAKSPLTWGQSFSLAIQPQSASMVTDVGTRAITSDDLPTSLSISTQTQPGL
jgi:hypothetical protein